jgi:TatA/E family protein of Tat protein translocase
MSLGPAEILVVLLLALVVFGPKRLPEVGRQVGGALRELRKVQDTVQHEIRSVLDDTVGPVHTMLGHDPTSHDQLRKELHSAEPDLGDEHHVPPAIPEAEATPKPEAPDIDGLSGGTFS